MTYQRQRPPSLVLTKTIRSILRKAIQSKCVSSEVRDSCMKVLNSDSEAVENSSVDTTQSKKNPAVVPISIIRDVYQNFKDNGQKLYLHEIVEGSELYLESSIPPPRNPELVARIEQMKIKAENEEYKRMTQNVDQMGRTRFTFQDDVKVMNRQLTAILNFLVTVIAGFAFGYKAMELSFGQNLAMQMLAGLTVGTIIFFVDLYFLVKYYPL